MKPYKLREANAYPYYKLATWDARSMTFRDGKVAYPSEAAAIHAIPKASNKIAAIPGKYRISVVTAVGRSDLKEFEVGEMIGDD